MGGSQYMTNTSLYISFPVNKLSQYLSKPTTMHWQCVKRVLRYLKGTIDLGLHMPSLDLNLIGYFDID